MKNYDVRSRLRLAGACLGLWAAVLWAQDVNAAADAVLSQAEQAFAQGDAKRAVELYEGLLQGEKQGPATQLAATGRRAPIKDARVYANLGAAYAQLGDRGAAAWAYRMARRFAPRDVNIAADARLVLGEEASGDRSLSPVQRFKRGEWPGVSALTHDELAFVGAVLYAAVWIAAFVWLGTRRAGARRVWLASVAFFALWAVFSGPRVYRGWAESRAVLVGSPASVYTSVVGGAALFELSPGTEVTVIKRERFKLPEAGDDGAKTAEEWIYIGLADGRKGWVKDAALRELL